MPRVSLSRVYMFSSAHRLHSPHLSSDKNWDIYDKCNNPNGHGHNYTVEVTVSGKPDAQTGMIMPLPRLDACVKNVLKELDFRHLDKEVPYFQETISTAENIIDYLWKRLEGELGERLIHLKLWETNNNFFETGRIDQ